MSDKEEIDRWIGLMHEKLGIRPEVAGGGERGHFGRGPRALEEEEEEVQASAGDALPVSIVATRPVVGTRFKVTGMTAPNATVTLHVLEGSCSPSNKHPTPFAKVQASGLGAIRFVSTVVGTPIPGIGKKVIAIATLDERSGFGCATVQPD